MIIGLHGAKKSGKDTAALNFPTFKKFAFADPLKQAVKLIFNLTDHQLSDDVAKETVDERYGITPRIMMQEVGSACRKLDKDIFIKHMKNRVAEATGSCILITDIRYDNEAEYVISEGGTIIKITRPSIERLDTHSSEVPISEHYIYTNIVNDSTIEEFHKKVNDCLSLLLLV